MCSESVSLLQSLPCDIQPANDVSEWDINTDFSNGSALYKAKFVSIVHKKVSFLLHRKSPCNHYESNTAQENYYNYYNPDVCTLHSHWCENLIQQLSLLDLRLLSQWWLWRVFVFWDITPCSPVKVNPDFHRTTKCFIHKTELFKTISLFILGTNWN
jgi:hypothetical protein